MVGEYGFRPPLNSVAQRIVDAEFFYVGPTANVAKMLPGVVVMGDGIGSVKEADGTSPYYGILGYEDAQTGESRPKNRDTAYSAGARVPVHVDVGLRVRARLAAGETIVKGDHLSVSTGGLLVKAEDDAVIYAKAEEPITSTASGTPIWVKTVI